MKPTCTKCRFFHDDGWRVHECRRYPQWVKRSTFDWCGEFEAQGTEAGTAETGTGSVHDGPVPQGCAQPPSGDPS